MVFTRINILGVMMWRINWELQWKSVITNSVVNEHSVIITVITEFDCSRLLPVLFNLPPEFCEVLVILYHKLEKSTILIRYLFVIWGHVWIFNLIFLFFYAFLLNRSVWFVVKCSNIIRFLLSQFYDFKEMTKNVSFQVQVPRLPPKRRKPNQYVPTIKTRLWHNNNNNNRKINLRQQQQQQPKHRLSLPLRPFFRQLGIKWEKLQSTFLKVKLRCFHIIWNGPIYCLHTFIDGIFVVSYL